MGVSFALAPPSLRWENIWLVVLYRKMQLHRLISPLRADWQDHAKYGAFSQFAAHVDPPLMSLDDAVGNRQAEPGTRADGLGGKERLENPFDVFRRDTRPVVFNLNPDGLRCCPRITAGT